MAQDIHSIDTKIKRQEFESGYRGAERDKFLQLVTVAERDLEQRRQHWTARHAAGGGTTAPCGSSRSELEDLKAGRRSVENSRPPPTVIEHLPTPLAKTVFGKEVHFRLLGGRVSLRPVGRTRDAVEGRGPAARSGN